MRAAVGPGPSYRIGAGHAVIDRDNIHRWSMIAARIPHFPQRAVVSRPATRPLLSRNVVVSPFVVALPVVRPPLSRNVVALPLDAALDDACAALTAWKADMGRAAR